MAAEPAAHRFESLSKAALYDLADQLLLNDPAAVAECVSFVIAETRGNWHGRARAKMCRRLKHCDLDPGQREQLVNCILGRLHSGDFSEQFHDQLRFALYADREAVLAAARENLSSRPKRYVARYSLWVLQHHCG